MLGKNKKEETAVVCINLTKTEEEITKHTNHTTSNE